MPWVCPQPSLAHPSHARSWTVSCKRSRIVVYVKRVRQGRIQRFDSVQELVTLCRVRFPAHNIRTVNTDEGDFMLEVRGPHCFESLIMHSEGSRCYSVMLPS